MKSFDSLREKYPVFTYQNYSYSTQEGDLIASFNFKIDPDIKFNPEIKIKNIDLLRFGKLDKEVIDNFIFHLGLMEIPTYWKSTCSSKIEIKTGKLDKGQIKWWKNLIVRGMGQFFYENKIDFRKKEFLEIVSNSKEKNRTLSVFKEKLKDRYLIPIGGGKDSIVTLERLKKTKEVNCFLLNSHKIPTQKGIMEVAGIKNPIEVEREIDKKLIELNSQGYLNGHTPFTAVLSFLSLFSAVLFDYKYIAFSNEKSANEGNIKYLGKTINHQYAKSSDFEKKFQKYAKKYLVKNIHYFSYLKKYTELEISKMFSLYKKYFPVFSSCNAGLKTGEKWCCNCPKCLFAYISLYPYLKNQDLIKIFENDIFENENLLPTLKDSIGVGEHKPFECVGTYKETKKALDLSFKKAQNEGQLPYLLKKYDEIKRTGK
jgi:hypothetical protein